MTNDQNRLSRLMEAGYNAADKLSFPFMATDTELEAYMEGFKARVSELITKERWMMENGNR